MTTAQPAAGRRRAGLIGWLARQSLATRLFLSNLLWSVAILAAAGLLLSQVNERAAEQDFDTRLGVYLRALVAAAAANVDDAHGSAPELGDPLFELPLSGWYWQITRLDTPKPEIRASKSLFADRLPPLSQLGVPMAAGGARRGYAAGPDDQRIRIVERTIDAGDDGRYLVQVAAPPGDVEADIASFNASLGLTFSVLALLLVGSSLLQLRFGLRPLRRIREGVAAIRRGERERIEGRYPPDLAPLAGEVNLLIASNREVVERARTQVGNLAHALKTPLSVLVNEAAAERDADPALAEKVREQAGIMRDQVTYYLDRARVAARASVVGSATDVGEAVEALARTFGKIYRDRHLTIETAVPGGLRFRGERQDFDDLVGNLVDNAAKWASGAVRVEAALAADPDGHAAPEIVLIVDDDGPGLPEAARAEAVRRGRRLDETRPGSGLGLSIVTDLAAAYAGQLSLHDSPLGGLRAILRLPAGNADFRPNVV